MRRPGLLALLAVLTLAAAGPAWSQLGDGHGIHVEQIREIDARQLDVRVRSEALQRPVDVRILLPTGYADAPRRRFPVLYLFHGTSGRASDWVALGDAVATTAGLPLIVVMPDAGFDADGGGWFADWFNAGAGGPPMWETFHIAQVIPWIDDNLRTVRARRGRAIAGLSQGGFGALSYAARHPELFTSVASFSGACVIDRDPDVIAIATSIIQFTTTALSGVADPDAIFGPRATQSLNWQAHDPGTLVENLRGMQIALWTGDGTAGPLDPVPGVPGTDPIEVTTFNATRLFDGYLDEVGIPHTYSYYGAGTHTWPYWARDLREYMEPLMDRFRARARRPPTIDYLSTDDRFGQWGWEVALERPAQTFSALRRARRRGFELTGAGTASVRTPSFYRAGSRVRVTTRGPAGRSNREMVVGASRRLRMTVPLGDGTTSQTARVRMQPVD